MNQPFNEVPNTASLSDFHKNNKLNRSLTDSDKRRYENNPWGCLHPGMTSIHYHIFIFNLFTGEGSYLPHVILNGKGIAIGRGKDAFVSKVNPINFREFSIFSFNSDIDICR